MIVAITTYKRSLVLFLLLPFQTADKRGDTFTRLMGKNYIKLSLVSKLHLSSSDCITTPIVKAREWQNIVLLIFMKKMAYLLKIFSSRSSTPGKSIHSKQENIRQRSCSGRKLQFILKGFRSVWKVRSSQRTSQKAEE